jgi:hypothetical protein
MDLPVRAANMLLESAGFSPSYQERDLAEDVMRPYATAIRAILDQHDPYPGLALDASGKVHMTNTAYDRLNPHAMERTPEENLDRFYGLGWMRERCENWAEVAWARSVRRTA